MTIFQGNYFFCMFFETANTVNWNTDVERKVSYIHLISRDESIKEASMEWWHWKVEEEISKRKVGWTSNANMEYNRQGRENGLTCSFTSVYRIDFLCHRIKNMIKDNEALRTYCACVINTSSGVAHTSVLLEKLPWPVTSTFIFGRAEKIIDVLIARRMKKEKRKRRKNIEAFVGNKKKRATVQLKHNLSS